MTVTSPAAVTGVTAHSIPLTPPKSCHWVTSASMSKVPVPIYAGQTVETMKPESESVSASVGEAGVNKYLPEKTHHNILQAQPFMMVVGLVGRPALV